MEPQVHSEFIPIRMLNEFTYCPRLAYLEWVAGEWRENADTIEGRIQHRNVDKASGDLEAITEFRETYSARSVSMSSATLGISTKMDLVESRDGAVIPIEYKKGTCPEKGPYLPEQVQVAAQALILRDNGYHVTEGAIFYFGSRNRISVPLTDSLISITLQAIDDLKKTAQSETPPPVLIDSPKCPRCSLVGICLPDETHLLQEESLTTRPRKLIASLPSGVPVYLTQAGTFVGKSGDRLIVKEKTEVLQEIRLRDIDHVAVFGNVQLSTQAIQALIQADIPITYHSSGGWFIGQTTGHSHKNILLRRAQFRVAGSLNESVAVAQHFVSGKILNSRTLLRRNARNIDSSVLTKLKYLSQKAFQTTTLDELIGIEGAAAQLYFSHFPTMFKSHGLTFDWNHRNRRPPKDPVNALLSLGYAILAKQFTVTALSVGLDPYLGFLHQPKYGKPALALDLMEEFRSLIVDSTVITTINTGEISDTHFISRNGEVALTTPGRITFINSLERRLNTEVTHPVYGYKVSYRRAFEIQARILSKALIGEIPTYKPFQTR